MTKMTAMPIYGKTPLKIFFKPEGRWPWDLVCSIGDMGPTKFVQMMILSWPWPTNRQGKICFQMHLNWIFFMKSWFMNTVEAKVIILT